MDEALDINFIDNEITLLYKWGHRLGMPNKFVILEKPTQPELIGLTYVDKLKRYVGRRAHEVIISEIDITSPLDTTLVTKFIEIADKYDNIGLRDVLMIWFSYYWSTVQNLKSPDPQDKIVATFNRVYELIEIRPIEALNQVIERYKIWDQDAGSLRIEDNRTFKKILIFQEELLTRSPPYISEIDFIKVTVRGNLKNPATNLPPSIDDGIDIFDISKVSYDVPYIAYNSETDNYYKVYKGPSNDARPNYNLIIPPTGSSENPSTIYLTIWNGLGNPLRASQKSFSTSTYRLDRNEITFVTDLTPNQDEKRVGIKLSQALEMEIVNTMDVRSSANFRIYGVGNYDEITFSHFIMNDKRVSPYLYINETDVSYPYKKRLKYHYRSITEDIADSEKSTKQKDLTVVSSSVSFSIKQNILEAEVPVKVINLNRPNVFEEVTTDSYLEINIGKAVSREVVNHFVNILPRLLLLYQEQYDAYLNIYSFILPNFEGFLQKIDIQALEREQDKQRIPGTKSRKPTGIARGELIPGYNVSTIDKLSLMRERTSGAGLEEGEYTRLTFPENQPLTLDRSEVGAWESTRNVLEFPGKLPDGRNETWYFVCPSDKYPIVGVKKNTGNKTFNFGGVERLHRDIFPVVPHCYKLGHKVRDPSALQAKKGGREKYIITTMKQLPPDRLGVIRDDVVVKILKVFYQDFDFHRFGVQSSPNSFIHSVLIALTRSNLPTLTPIGASIGAGASVGARFPIDIDEYLRSDWNRREEMVRTFRVNLLDFIQPALLRQEMYDFSEAEISEQMVDPDKFFDPSLYYRVMEVLFSVNIYTFSPIDNSESSISIEIPKFREFHARPNKPNHPAIIIYKHRGNISELERYSQCELIFANFDTNGKKGRGGGGNIGDIGRESQSNVYSFGEDMNTILYNLVVDTTKSITWNIPPHINEPVTRSNLYSMTDFQQIFQSPDFQIIDSYGKLRGLVFKVQSEDIGERYVSVTIIPSRPENIPSIDKNDPIIQDYLPPVDIVQSIFSGNLATSYTVLIENIRGEDNDREKMVDGLWLRMYDIQHAIYCPFIPITLRQLNDKVGSLTEGPPNPLRTGTGNTISRSKRLRRTFEVILQFIYWVYFISGLNVEEFITRYLIMTPSNQADSADIYNFVKLTRKLPQNITPDLAINHISGEIPELIRNGRFSLYNDKFYRGITYLLRQYDRSTRGLRRVDSSQIGGALRLSSTVTEIPTGLIGLFQEESDFHQHNNTAIFVKEADLYSWLTSINRPNQNHALIRTSLNIEFNTLTDPYIYMSQDGDKNIYLIQNVAGGDKLTALNVAYNWYTRRINMGYRSVPYEINPERNSLPAHFTYFISNDDQPFAGEDFTAGNTKFLQILGYTKDNFAAMLPIL